MRKLTVLILCAALVGCTDAPKEKCTADGCYRNGFLVDSNGEYIADAKDNG